MTFREFIEQGLSEFESHLRREALEPATIEMRLRGARQFAPPLAWRAAAEGRSDDSQGPGGSVDSLYAVNGDPVWIKIKNPTYTGAQGRRAARTPALVPRLHMGGEPT